MIGNRAIDVNEIDGWIGENLIKFCVALRDPEVVCDTIQFRFISPANRDYFSQWVLLIDRNKLGPETQSHHRHSIRFILHKQLALFTVFRNRNGGIS